MQIQFNELKAMQEANNNASFGDLVTFPEIDSEGGVGVQIGGDLCAMKIDPELFIQWGESYVLCTPNGLFARDLMPGSTPEKIKCVSTNDKAYPPFEVDKASVYGFYKIVFKDLEN